MNTQAELDSREERDLSDQKLHPHVLQMIWQVLEKP